MSDQGTTQTAAESQAQSVAEEVVQVVGEVVTVLAPIAAAADPAIAGAVAIGAKIVAGAIALEPQAVALLNQIKGGTPPTAAQLAQYASDYEAAYQKLNADITAKLAATPPAS
jgi:hypothetical protein